MKRRLHTQFQPLVLFTRLQEPVGTDSYHIVDVVVPLDRKIYTETGFGAVVEIILNMATDLLKVL